MEKQGPMKPKGRYLLIFLILSVGLFVLILLSLALGAEPIPVQHSLAILASVLGLDAGTAYSFNEAYTLLEIRLPRALMAVLVGATLATAGTALQGLFRNPLAEPALIGISGGATLGAVLVILVVEGLALGASTLSVLGWLVPLGAFGTGMAFSWIVYHLATFRGRTSVIHLLLGGIAMNALIGATLGFLIFLADDAQVRTINFWTLGSLSAASWRTVGVVSPFVLLGLLGLLSFARVLNALLLGESEAVHLGIRLQRLKQRLFVLIALSVGATVAFTGIISFVGLVVPQLLRLWLGPDHRGLLPGSILLGAALLLAADLLARTLLAPAEMPIGIITALVGAPFFISLLLQSKKRQG